MAGEFGIGDDIDAVDAADGSQVVQDMVDHGLAGDRKEGFGLGECKRVEAGGIASGQDK